MNVGDKKIFYGGLPEISKLQVGNDYTEIPHQIGVWADGTPIWRVAITDKPIPYINGNPTLYEDRCYSPFYNYETIEADLLFINSTDNVKIINGYMKVNGENIRTDDLFGVEFDFENAGINSLINTHNTFYLSGYVEFVTPTANMQQPYILLNDNVASGTCGATSSDNINWTLDSNGVLTISGTGNMKNYIRNVQPGANSPAPWHNYKSQIKEVIVTGEITYIGNYAFSDCSNLLSVNISNSVTNIGTFCFFNCSKLKNVNLSSNLTTLGSNCFKSCNSLESIILPNSITTMGTNLFYGCSKLKNINIPNNENCNTISSYEFYYCGLECITIPNNITTIDDFAFDGCTNLKAINLPNDIDHINDYAFQNCNKLSDICYPNAQSVNDLSNCTISSNGNLDTFINQSKQYGFLYLKEYDVRVKTI